MLMQHFCVLEEVIGADLYTRGLYLTPTYCSEARSGLPKLLKLSERFLFNFICLSSYLQLPVPHRPAQARLSHSS